MLRIIFVFSTLQFFIINVVYSDLPTIRQTQNGPVEGIEQMSILGQKYYSFRGIPFAAPPITGTDPYTGEQVDRRFKAPETLKYKWTKTLKAHNFSDTCMPARVPNPNSLNQSFSENCLYLNLYIPAGGAEKKTVLVFIHGGGFAGYGVSGQYLGPDFLLSEDNILITFTYRFGIFGFLNLDYGEYTGNMALKDQQMALKWVYENIENFSGNKDEILLFGQSKGGACVHFQMLNKESRSYFRRAFSMSGTAFHCHPLSLIEGNNVEKMQNCTKINEINEMVKHLTTTDIGNLLEYNLECNVVWSPTIESINAPNAFVTKSLEEIYNSTDAPTMDAMFSFDSGEGIESFKEFLKTEPIIEANWKQTTVDLPFFIDGFTKEIYPKEYDQAMSLLREEYFSSTVSTKEMPYRNMGFLSDMGLVWGILKAVMYQANANANANNFFVKSGPKNTYLFRFSVHTNLNSFYVQSNFSYVGASHGDCTCFIFPCSEIGSKNYTDDFKTNDLNFQIMKRSVKMITNFARTGDPSIEGRTPFKSCQSSKEIFCTDVTNNPISQILTDIKQQSHYDAWFEVMEIYKNANKSYSKSGTKTHKIIDNNLSKIGLIFINLLFYQMYS